MKNYRYKITKDGMWLVHNKTGEKIPVPSPIKLCNANGLRTKLDIGKPGKQKMIWRSVIDESEFSLGEPPVYGKSAPRKLATKQVASPATQPAARTTVDKIVENLDAAIKEMTYYLETITKVRDMLNTGR